MTHVAKSRKSRVPSLLPVSMKSFQDIQISKLRHPSEEHLRILRKGVPIGEGKITGLLLTMLGALALN